MKSTRVNLTMTREGVTTSVETPVLEMKASLATGVPASRDAAPSDDD
jgi:hypothetical protein